MAGNPLQAADWLKARVTGALRSDSRAVSAGDGFIAWPGAATDARAFVPAALQTGAAAVLVEQSGADAFALDGDERVLQYPGLKADAGPIAAAYYDHPSRHLDVLAVTGTNGKTSTSWWLAQALLALPGALATPCAIVGTLGIGTPDGSLVATGLTTPDPVTLQGALRAMVERGVRAVAIEASSIGLQEQRLAGTHIRLALFTNFTQDHLDYHGSMAAYWAAKQQLFAWPGLRSAVVNVDDAMGAQLAQTLADTAIDVWTVAIDRPARLRATGVQHLAGALAFDVCEGPAQQAVQVPLIGSYNVSNVLGVLAALRALGVPLADAARVCSQLQPVPGRMECMTAPQAPLVAVDYAHTPDALASALAALRPLAQQRGGRLWCVFGCGGGRDASKRPLMGAIAAQGADRVVVTSDNPRQESPHTILAQIVQGTPLSGRVLVEPDRALAIARTLAQADAADVVLVAGKGHEQTQEVADAKRPFSDRQHVEQALAQRAPVVPTEWASSMMELQHALAWLPGARLVGDGAVLVRRVHTDTRSIAPGDLFVALRGEKFDANSLLLQAQQQGAVALLCHAGLPAAQYPQGLARIEVPDTRVALGQLAAGWRAQFDLPLIAVTGSNGKTTVTQMLASILAAHAPHGQSLATQGNLNNEIGVPLTLLRLRAQHRMAVVELGMNHPGEIAVLAAMARPTVALVNNAQREHLEFMHTVHAVAQENGAVLSALPATGVAVFPSDDDYAPVWRALAQPRSMACFSGANDARAASPAVGQDLQSLSSEWSEGAWQVHAGAVDVQLHFALHIAGRHNVRNALAAARCALAAGVAAPQVEQGLAAFVPVRGRSRALQLVAHGHSRTLVDDTYNANPDSVRAAIEVLRELPQPRLLVLGDMGEVGHEGPAFHAEAGAHARDAGIEQMYCLGALASHAAAAFGPPGAARHFESMEALVTAVQEALPSTASVLVKGSRFMRMERVVAALEPYATKNGVEICC